MIFNVREKKVRARKEKQVRFDEILLVFLLLSYHFGEVQTFVNLVELKNCCKMRLPSLS